MAVARALAATDPDGAERIASSITDEFWKPLALSDVAKALAATDPGRAERIANFITKESSKVSVLIATDLDHAERFASSITDEPSKAWALSRIAKALIAASS